jgi:hypothetical protein
MSDMPSEFTKFSSDELIQFQKENFAGSKELRHEMCALLDNRLARKITKEEFDFQRNLINDNVLVLKRRRSALDDERLTRMRRNPRFAHRAVGPKHCIVGAGSNTSSGVAVVFQQAAETVTTLNRTASSISLLRIRE